MKFIQKRSVYIYIMGFFIARAAFEEMNPLAIGFFTAAYLEGAGGGILLISILLGLYSNLSNAEFIKYALTIIGSLIILGSPLLKKKSVNQHICYGIPAIVLGIFSYTELGAIGFNQTSFLFATLEVFIAYITGYLFRQWMKYLLHESKARLSNEQLLSLAFTIAVIIYGIPNLQESPIALLDTVVYFLILMFTYNYGVGQGTIVGVVSGLSLGLRGSGMEEVGFLPLLGIIPAAFRELGRIPTAIMFATTAIVSRLVIQEQTLSVEEIAPMVSAMVLFLLLPKDIIFRQESYEGQIEEEGLAAMNLKRLANSKMQIFSDSFLKLSKTLDSLADKQIGLGENDINGIFEDISEKLCKNCKKCSYCWEEKFQETYDSTCYMFEKAGKDGFLQQEDIPAYFRDTCICADEYLKETNRFFEIAKLNHIWSNKMAESREVIAEQLKEVSTVIQNITRDIYGSAQTLRMEEGLVERRLKSEHILVKNIAVVEREDKRKEIYLLAAAARGYCFTAKEVATIIGDTLGIKVKPSEASKTVISKKYDNFIFVEDTKFKILHGMARAMKDSVSGDNFSIVRMETGNFLMAISDGMGTGKEAGDDSETVLSLLEHLIEAGFRTETAVKLINSSLVLKQDKQTFSTLDLSVIDLFTGMCEFTKIGAASTFIKRDNWVETISSTTLPIGMFGNVDYDSVTKKLYEGDIILMVTDGVLDSMEGEDKETAMEQFLANIQSNNPQEIANQVLNYALSRTNFIPMDDMTVIAAGIWLK